MKTRGGDEAVHIGVVTDSTACLTEELLAGREERARVVPLNVTIGEETFVEGESVTGEEVARAQADGLSVMTSRPSPACFVDAYRSLADAGCDRIVSVHASSTLSSTVDSARLAAVESPVPVDVLDSRTIGMALGFGAMAALDASLAGGDAQAVMQAAEETLASSHTAFYVDSLEPLRRGGRVGRAGSLFGAALSIKPLLHVTDGAIAPLARVRTSHKAMDRLASWARTQAEPLPADGRVCAVHSLQRPGLAQRLMADLAEGDGRELLESSHEDAHHEGERVPWALGPVAVPLGAVVTAHVGAGAIAVVVARMPSP